ncbi:MAG: tetratricopeptide repeat protein [Pseudomonadota bacterium]
MSAARTFRLPPRLKVQLFAAFLVGFLSVGPGQAAPIIGGDLAVEFERAQDVMDAGRYQEALLLFNRMAARDDLTPAEQAVIDKQLGHLTLKLNDVGAAIDAFERARSAKALPRDMQRDVEYRLGELYAAAGDADAAATVLSEWFEQVRRPPTSAYFLLANVHVIRGENDLALPLVEAGLRTRGPFTEAWYRLALSLFEEADRAEEQIDLLRKLIDGRPREKILWQKLARAYDLTGQGAAAEAVRHLIFEQGLLQTTDELIAYAEVAWIAGRPNTALEALDAVAVSERETLRYLHLRAEVLRHLKDSDGAFQVLGEAALLDTTGTSLGLQGQAALDRRDWVIARDAFETALERGRLIDPNAVWLGLGKARAMLGDPSAAEAFVQALADPALSPPRTEEAQAWLAYLDAARN